MEVILLEKIHRLGQLGDKVRVRAGYGRNYLIPQRRAVPATPENVEKFESQRAELEKAQSSTLAAALLRVEKLNGLEVTVSAKAAAEGKLYGSIGAAEIAEAVGSTGNQLEKREIRLPDGPIRDVGTHTVTVHLHADAETTITVIVVSEDELSAASEE